MPISNPETVAARARNTDIERQQRTLAGIPELIVTQLFGHRGYVECLPVRTSESASRNVGGREFHMAVDRAALREDPDKTLLRQMRQSFPNRLAADPEMVAKTGSGHCRARPYLADDDLVPQPIMQLVGLGATGNQAECREIPSRIKSIATCCHVLRI